MRKTVIALSGNQEIVGPVKARLEKMGSLQVEEIRGNAILQWIVLRSKSIAGQKVDYTLSFDFIKGIPTMEWHSEKATQNYAEMPSFHIWQLSSQNGSNFMLGALGENMRSSTHPTSIVLEQPPSLAKLLKTTGYTGEIYSIILQHYINAMDMDKASLKSEAMYRGLMSKNMMAKGAAEFSNRTIEVLLRTNIPSGGIIRTINDIQDVLESLSESRKRLNAIHIEVPREYTDTLGFFNSFANAVAYWVQETMDKKQ